MLCQQIETVFVTSKMLLEVANQVSLLISQQLALKLIRILLRLQHIHDPRPKQAINEAKV